MNEQEFHTWASDNFGYGYGSGEFYILPCIKRFFELLPPENKCYDHEELERELTPVVCWFIINALCMCDVIDYGTSTRYGWLTDFGLQLKEFVLSKSTEELYKISMNGESTEKTQDKDNLTFLGIPIIIKEPVRFDNLTFMGMPVRFNKGEQK